MYQGKKIAVIIAAAGSGKRMGGGIPKQFRDMGSVPVLTRTMMAFEDQNNIDYMVIVTQEESISYCKTNMVRPFGFCTVIDIVAGG